MRGVGRNLSVGDPSNTPHPTSLREATFSHKGRRKGAHQPDRRKDQSGAAELQELHLGHRMIDQQRLADQRVGRPERHGTEGEGQRHRGGAGPFFPHDRAEAQRR